MGKLEAHDNGLRFSSNKGANIDILYSNIKHAFFQEAIKDTIVLIHFHLHHSIMVGKKNKKIFNFILKLLNKLINLLVEKEKI